MRQGKPRRPGPFRIQLRDRGASASSAKVFSGSHPESVLRDALAADVSPYADPILTWQGDETDRLVALDFDVPGDGRGFAKTANLDALLDGSLVRPAAAWVTKSGGLRVVFVAVNGTPALAVAAVWLVLHLPERIRSWRLEIKTDTRHPGTSHSDPARNCSAVTHFAPSLVIDAAGGRTRRTLSAAEWESLLETRGIEPGRHRAESCPIPWCPDRRKTSGSACIEVNERGMHCFRCNIHAFPDQLAKGSESVGATHPLIEAVRHSVHGEQFIATARGLHPSLPARLASLAWKTIARAVWGGGAATTGAARPPRGAKSPGLVGPPELGHFPFVRDATGRWLDARTHDPVSLSRDTLRTAPFVSGPADIDRAMSNVALPGFAPLAKLAPEYIRSPWIDHRTAPLRLLPRDGIDRESFDPGQPPSPKEFRDAAGTLESLVAGFHANAVAAMVIANFAAQPATMPPPMFVLTGPTKAGKTASTQAAASLVGGPVKSIAIATEAKDVARSIGLALDEGAAFVFCDEVGRGNVTRSFGVLLALTSRHRFDAKFENEREIDVTAPIVLAGSSLPKVFLESPELSRRSVLFALEKKATGSVSPLAIRRDPRTRTAAMTFARWCWHTARSLRRPADWRDFVLSRLGGSTLAHLHGLDDGGAEAAALLGLYEAYRSRPLPTDGWIVVDDDDPVEAHLDALDVLKATGTEIATRLKNLNAGRLDDVLGLPSRDLVRLHIDRRGGGAIRFKFTRRHGLRGSGPAPAEWPCAAPRPTREICPTPDPEPSLFVGQTWNIAMPEDGRLGIWHSVEVGPTAVHAVALPDGRCFAWVDGDTPPELVDAVSDRPLRLAVADPGSVASHLGSFGIIELDLGGAMRILGMTLDPCGLGELPWTSGGEHEALEAARATFAGSRTAHERLHAGLDLARAAVDNLVRVRQFVDLELPDRSRRDLVADRALNARGIWIDRDLLAAVKWAIEELPSDLMTVAGCAGWSPTDGRTAAAHLGLDKITATEARTVALDPSRAAAHRTIAEAWLLANSKVRTWTNGLAASLEDDGRVREVLRFSGAATGRWSARRHRVHNLWSSTAATPAVVLALTDRDTAALRALGTQHRTTLAELVESAARGVFAAPPGRRFVQADYGQIEPRVLAWLSGDTLTLEAARSGGDIYRRYASLIFGLADPTDATDAQRATAKAIFVPIAYGTGRARLESILAGVAPGTTNARPSVDDLLRAFDTNAGPVLRLRDDLWSAFVDVAAGERDGPELVGQLTVHRDEQHDGVRIELPSGRSLVYASIRAEASGVVADTLGRERRLHPGALLENVAQAVARDILADALVRLEHHGFECVLHVHDEAIVEVGDEAGASESRELVEWVLETPPEWASDLPLRAEASIGRRFV